MRQIFMRIINRLIGDVGRASSSQLTAENLLVFNPELPRGGRLNGPGVRTGPREGASSVTDLAAVRRARSTGPSPLRPKTGQRRAVS
jgi:hypothetical protein